MARYGRAGCSRAVMQAQSVALRLLQFNQQSASLAPPCRVHPPADALEVWGGGESRPRQCRRAFPVAYLAM